MDEENNMLQKLLKERKCFKLICGASNQNLNDIEKLTAVYYAAGVRYFDLSADKKVLQSALNGIRRVSDRDDFFLCASLGLSGDVHLRKAKMQQQKCIGCGRCAVDCLNKAICRSNDIFVIDKDKCIGCSSCSNSCKSGAIELIDVATSIEQSLNEIKDFPVSSIELHSNGQDKNQLLESWNHLNKTFKGLLSLCLSSQDLDQNTYIELVSSLVSTREAYSTIIQADGNAMSGSNNLQTTTQKALEVAKIVEDANLPVFIIPSGGTNAQTSKLAKKAQINIHGVAMGTFARLYVTEYVDLEEFWVGSQVFESAAKKAKILVNETLKWLS